MILLYTITNFKSEWFLKNFSRLPGRQAFSHLEICLPFILITFLEFDRLQYWFTWPRADNFLSLADFFFNDTERCLWSDLPFQLFEIILKVNFLAFFPTRIEKLSSQIWSHNFLRFFLLIVAKVVLFEDILRTQLLNCCVLIMTR